MANKKNNQKKSKQDNKSRSQKGGAASFDDLGAPQPARKKNKNKK
ncbi:MAG: hypothetical protein ABFD54_12420 [Armatimonadota bacterium]